MDDPTAPARGILIALAVGFAIYIVSGVLWMYVK